MNANSERVPKTLRTWFVIHFIADVLFGFPLLFFPQAILNFFGWTTYDPIMTRLVGAALLGIGIESFLGRNASADTYRGLLNLKLIWSSCALFAIGVGIAEGAPISAWLFLVVFVMFWGVWVYYRVKIRR
ncbi:MAG: hypothetical protein QGM50_05295 [Anaerolineae bacterium]|nr:hypothetical protein [Anaerolineae bacterium]MDK1079880.1 hypothetical protein [Anaerolineae bacterium]MDK1118191.1 hypothetical protein [Anaerolineae bacterium]